MSSSRDKWLGVLISLFIISRLLILLFDFSELAQLEELYNGTLAREIVRGPFLPLLQLRYIEYQSGSLIVSFIAIPLFYLFGTSYFTLKLVALLFSAATLILFYLLLKHFYSRRVATWGGILFVFCPRIFALLNLKVEGANSQAILITFAIWYLFFSLLHYGDHRPPGIKREGRENALAFLIGLLCSFGVWFCPVVLIVVACIIIISFARDKLFCLRKRFVYSFAGFWAGAIPAIIDYSKTDYAGLRYLMTQPYQGRTSTFISSVTELWGRGLLNSFSSKDMVISGRLINIYFYALAVFSIILYLYYQRGCITSFLRAMVSPGHSRPLSFEVVKYIAFLLYIILFSIAYGASKYHISESPIAMDAYRYFVTLYPFLFIMVVLTMDEVWARGSKIVAGVVAVGIVLGLGEIIASVHREECGTGLQLKGYSYEMLGLRIYEICGGDPQRAIDLVEKNLGESELRDACMMGFAYMYVLEFVDGGNGKQIQQLVSSLAKIDEQWRFYFYRMLGQILSPEYVRATGPMEWQGQLNAIDGKNRAYYYQGLGCALAHRFRNNQEAREKILAHIPPEFRSSFESGTALPWYSL